MKFELDTTAKTVKLLTDATLGAWTSVFAVVLNLYNTISHLFKKE